MRNDDKNHESIDDFFAAQTVCEGGEARVGSGNPKHRGICDKPTLSWSQQSALVSIE